MFTNLLLLTASSAFLSCTAASPTEHNATTNATVGWVSDGDNSRSTISMLYNCSFTIFLCTWSAMHLNVPGNNDNQFQIFVRKCKWMLVGVLAPEVVAFLAMDEWNTARVFVKREPYLSTITHGFFATMGGYAIRTKNSDVEEDSPRTLRLTAKGFIELSKLQSLEVPPKMELMDKSKGDWISKSITSVQVLWFASQLIGRAAQKLPVTTLELFTCAIVVCTAITYGAWWNKPLDVQRPIVLECDVSADFLKTNGILTSEEYRTFGDNVGFFEMKALHSYAVVSLIVLAFTACHLIGWGFYFPTRIELILWRVASVLCCVLPLALVFWNLIDKNSDDKGQLWKSVSDYGFNFFFGSYVIVRAYLLIEAFASLRSVPADVYVSVNWSAYIPHI